jgi:hypothetical protein
MAELQLRRPAVKAWTIGLLLYGTAAQPRHALNEEKYRLLAAKMIDRRWDVRTISYHDSRRDAVDREARQCDALLVWINPTESQLDRPALDALLRDVAAGGVLVSAHPDTILRIGTKDVLTTTQSIGWSIDAAAYQSFEEFRDRFPTMVRRQGTRVLKQFRGHSGRGIWKVGALASGAFEVTSASTDEPARVVDEDTLLAFFHAEVFARGSHLVDQRWVATMDRGMVRAYLCGSRLAGFGYQEIVALHPATPGEDFTRQHPSRRHYYTQDCYLFQSLRRRLEAEWIPALQTLVAMRDEDFPLLWDADFFFGGEPDPLFILCEINTSCVSPFPDSAVSPLIAELERRLVARQRPQGTIRARL